MYRDEMKTADFIVLNMGVRDFIDSAGVNKALYKRIIADKKEFRRAAASGIIKVLGKGLFLMPLSSPKKKIFGADALYLYADESGKVYEGAVFAEFGGVLVPVHRSEYGSASVNKLYSLKTRCELKKKCLFAGLCGSVSPALKAGDVFIPDSVGIGPALPPEKLKPGDIKILKVNPSIVKKLAALAGEEAHRSGGSVCTGTLFTSIYSPDDEAYLYKKGILKGFSAVDYESYFLLMNSLRKSYGLLAGFVLAVSNEYSKGQSLDYLAEKPGNRGSLVNMANKIAMKAGFIL